MSVGWLPPVTNNIYIYFIQYTPNLGLAACRVRSGKGAEREHRRSTLYFSYHTCNPATKTGRLRVVSLTHLGACTLAHPGTLLSTMSLDKDSPEDELVAYCASVPQGDVLGGKPSGNTVVKLSEGEVIKFGLGVTGEEAENQRIAYELVEPKNTHHSSRASLLQRRLR